MRLGCELGAAALCMQLDRWPHQSREVTPPRYVVSSRMWVCLEALLQRRLCIKPFFSSV